MSSLTSRHCVRSTWRGTCSSATAASDGSNMLLRTRIVSVVSSSKMDLRCFDDDNYSNYHHDYGHNKDRREAPDVSVCWFHPFFNQALVLPFFVYPSIHYVTIVVRYITIVVRSVATKTDQFSRLPCKTQSADLISCLSFLIQPRS